MYLLITVLFIIDGTSILKSIFVLLPMLVSECHPVFTCALSQVRASLVPGACVSRPRCVRLSPQVRASLAPGACVSRPGCDRLSSQVRVSLVPDANVSRPVCADKS